MVETETPSAEAARVARASLNDALFALPALPFAFDREAMRERLLRAIQSTYAVTGRPVLAVAHLVGLQQAAELAAEAHALLAAAAPPGNEAHEPVLDTLRAAGDALATAADEVAQDHLRHRDDLLGGSTEVTAPPVRPFTASIRSPALHAFPRPPLLPPVRVGQNPPGPPPVDAPPRLDLGQVIALARQLEAGASPALLHEEIARGSAPIVQDLWAYEPAVEEAEMLRRLARDSLEDIASHRTLRRPNPIETWLDQGPFEQRLLEHLDALAALGAPAVPAIPMFLAELDAPDPERAFAAAFALGCIDGYDTLVAAICLVHQADPDTFEGLAEGLALASNPAITQAMVELASARRPDLVAFALDVLHMRGDPADAALPALLERSEPDVLRRLARALASSGPAEVALQALSRMLLADDDDLFAEAATSLLVRGDLPVQDTLRAASQGTGARAVHALELLAWGGSADDARRVAEAALQAPSPRLVRAVGRAGDAASLAPLCALLTDEDEDVAGAAATALERITGAGMRETVEEPWELSLPPAARELGPLPTPMRTIERVPRDPAAWKAYLDEHAETFKGGRKWRGGKPFSPLAIVDELAFPRTPPDARVEAARELAVVCSSPFAFRPETWVTLQQEQLAALRSDVGRLPYSPGSWPRRGRAIEPVATSAAEPDRVLATALVEEDRTNRQLPSFMRAAARQAAEEASAPPPSFDAYLPAPVSSVAPPPPLRLEQYAALCAELHVFPARAEQVFLRYGLRTLRERIEVDTRWRERLRKDPAELRAWQALYAQWRVHFQRMTPA